jgi:malonyl-CoA O-methyltransferase
MAQRLAVIRLQPDAVVEWWGHTGGSAAVLANTYPRARRIVVEPSDALAERSRAALRAPWWSVQRWRDAAEVRRDDPPPGSAQLVWANMMLHAVADPPALLARWQRQLAVGGFAMFSCFGPDTLRELRELYRQLGWPPPAPEFVDMHDLGDMLVGAGFADPVMDQETLALTWGDPQALLTELRSLGCNASPARGTGLRTPRWRRRLVDALASLTGPDGRLRLSFEIVYGHAFKAAPRPPVKSETLVALDDLRLLARARRGSAG